MQSTNRFSVKHQFTVICFLILFFSPVLAGAESLASLTPGRGPIDRQSLVRRHNPMIQRADPLSPLSVGNGSFCFTADITGLQTFPQFYSQGIPLCIQSDWGWHTFDNPNGYHLEDTMGEYDSHGRKVN